MQTKSQVETEFRTELYALLKKYAATLEARDVYQGCPECGRDIRMIVTVPEIYLDEDRNVEREFTEIDFSDYVMPNSKIPNGIK
jgi:hypothetical protein